MEEKTQNNPGLDLVIEECRHVIEDLKFTAEHDDKLTGSQLLYLAQYCIFSNNDYLPKDTWSIDYIKQLHMKSRIDQLTIAAGLIISEINRRLRIKIGLNESEECELVKLTAERLNPDKWMTQEEFERWHELRKKKYGEY